MTVKAVAYRVHNIEKRNLLCSYLSRKQVEELQEAQMLRGNLSASEQLSQLSSHDDLSQALEGAFFVQVKY